MKRIIFVLLLSVGFSQNEKLIIGNVELELGQSFEIAFKKASIAGYDGKVRENMVGPLTVIDIYEKNKITEKIYKIGSLGIKKNKNDTSYDGISKRKIISLIKYYDKELENARGKSIVNVMFYALNYFHFNESKVKIELTDTSNSKIIHLRSTQDGIYREVTISNMVRPDGKNPSGGTNIVSVTELIMRSN